MNKTITIYGLLGLIKDGKAPKKIKYNDAIFEIDENGAYYCNDIEKQSDWFSNELILSKRDLENKVEILDEEDEFIEIKEINEANDYMENRINQLIHNQKILIEKIKEMK